MSYQKFKDIRDSIKARFDRNEGATTNTEFRYCENLFEISREYSDLTDRLLDYIKTNQPCHNLVSKILKNSSDESRLENPQVVDELFQLLLDFKLKVEEGIGEKE